MQFHRLAAALADSLPEASPAHQIGCNGWIFSLEVSQWKRQLLDGANELFTRGKQTRDGRDEGQAKEAELFQQIERQQMELEWLKKKSQLL